MNDRDLPSRPNGPPAARETATPEATAAPKTKVPAEARTEAMVRARRGDSTTKRARVAASVDTLLGAGTPITFASVARHAHVSSWLVYAPGVRDLIDTARTRQHAPHNGTGDHGGGSGDHGGDPSGPGLRTDLALARAEITRLRAERDQQHRQLQLALGARLDNISKADLITRVDELIATNTALAAATAQHRTDNQSLQHRVRDLEDDLAAARTSLRRMIRAENRHPDVLPAAPAPSPEGR